MLNVFQLHLPQGVLRALYFACLVALWEVDTSRIYSAKLTYLLSFLLFVGRWVEVGQTYLDIHNYVWMTCNHSCPETPACQLVYCSRAESVTKFIGGVELSTRLCIKSWTLAREGFVLSRSAQLGAGLKSLDRLPSR